MVGEPVMAEALIVNQPAVVAELEQVLYDYERALMANDLEALAGYFWDDEQVTRYGIADRQHGAAALRAYRAGTPAPSFTRTLHELRINAFGPDFATVQVEFLRSDTPLRGFQSQTWVRMAGSWKIVAAHVSMIPDIGFEAVAK